MCEMFDHFGVTLAAELIEQKAPSLNLMSGKLIISDIIKGSDSFKIKPAVPP